MKVGITGTIASGKSLVTEMIGNTGYPVFSADACVHELYLPGHAVYEQLGIAFGKDVYKSDGSVDFRYLGDIIFTDDGKRKELDDLVHPAVKSCMLAFFADQEKTLAFAEVPLLFQAGWEDLFDHIIVVYADYETACNRMMTNRGYSKAEAERRYRSQMDPELQKKKADIRIANNGSEEELWQRVSEVIQQLEEENEK